MNFDARPKAEKESALINSHAKQLVICRHIIKQIYIDVDLTVFLFVDLWYF